MLKNIKIYTLFILTLGFMACSTDNDVEPLFDQDIDSRVDALLLNYKKILTTPEFGWKADYIPEEGEPLFRIHLNFNDDNTVESTSDYKNGENDLPSTYRVGKSQFPELILENYSTLHSLFEVQQFALGAEFEFIFDEVSSDKIVLRSKTDKDQKSIITLTPATATDKNNIIASREFETRLKDRHLTSNFFRSLIVTNASSEQVFSSNFSFDIDRRRGVFTGEDTNNVVSSYDLPLNTTETGFDFEIPFSFNGIDFKSFIYDEGTNTFISTVGDLTTTILASIEPGYISNDIFSIGQSSSGPRFLYRRSFDSPFVSSGFEAIIDQLNADASSTFGFSFNQFFFETNPEISGNNTTLSIVLNEIADPTNSITFYYEYEATIVDKKLILTYIGPSTTQGNPSFNGLLEANALPLINFYGNPLGLIYTDRGNFLNFINLGSSFSSIQDPSLSVYGPWVNF